ncbi:cation transporter [candidate division KSB1 bacterium]|nr:cation transporter [candidate division KSB1 bacterium]
MSLNFIITIAEIIGGLLSGSLALISDALHNFSDGIAVIISFIALNLRSRRHSSRHTFGLKRAEILAAVINSVVLLGLSLYLFYESVLRLIQPVEIQGKLMLIVASIGLVANVLGTWLLKRDSHHSINIKSAYLHLLADAVSSVAVIIGGAAIYFWEIYWIDPSLTILIGVYILRESYHILSDAIHILMEGAPEDISLVSIQEAIESLPGIQNVHHLHLWTVGERDIHLQAHVNVDDMLVSQSDSLRVKIEQLLSTRFGIRHVTLQIECKPCDDVGLIHNSIDHDESDHP